MKKNCTKHAGFVVISMATRFAEVSKEDVTILVNEAVPQKTKEATSYAVKVFEGKETLRKFGLLYFSELSVPLGNLS